jgi:hypothetical protein
MRAHTPTVAAIGLLALLIWSGASGAGATAAVTSGTAATAPTASDSQTRTPRQRRMASVVRAWSAKLNAGDNAGVAKLFALPARIVQGPFLYRLRTRKDVATWHAGLPCAGRIVSITFRGRYATAVFRLGNRGVTACDAPGSLAAARFEIVEGKIVSWEQVEVPKKRGDASQPVA